MTISSNGRPESGTTSSFSCTYDLVELLFHDLYGYILTQ